MATSSVTYVANLPSSQTTNYSSSASSVNVYDSLGSTHATTYTWTKTATNDWSLTVKVTGGGGTSTNGTAIDKTVTIPFVFGTDGTPSSITSGTGYTRISNSSNEAGVTLSLSFAGAAAQTVTLDFGTFGAATGLTQYADTAVSVTSFEQNGLAKGQYSGLSISSSGLVTVNYTNGSNKTIAQIPIVLFNSQDNLQSVTGNAYQATLASGTAKYTTAGSSGAGTVSSSSLEGSNVDIATQYTSLITAQQVYSANAKVITAINQMLTTIVNIVQ